MSDNDELLPFKHAWPRPEFLTGRRWRRVWSVGLDEPVDSPTLSRLRDLARDVSTRSILVRFEEHQSLLRVVVESQLHPMDEVAYVETMAAIRALGRVGLSVRTVEGDPRQTWALLKRMDDFAGP